MKVSASEPLEPLSGKTIPITAQKDPVKIKRLIEASRKNYASVYKKPTKAAPLEPTKQEKKTDQESVGCLVE